MSTIEKSNPIYTLETKDFNRLHHIGIIPKVITWIKGIFLTLLAIYTVYDFFFIPAKESIFGRVTPTVLVIIFVAVAKLGPKRPLIEYELFFEFYEDYMIIYKPFVVFPKNSLRNENKKIYYKDIRSITYDSNMNHLIINGLVEFTHFEIIDDVVQPNPMYHDITEANVTHFTQLMDISEVMNALEHYTGVTVNVTK